MNCRICKKKVDYLESHHIVPKSRGGLDDESNLIKICVDCHSKAHDVSFSRADGKGLINEGIQRRKKNHAEAESWLNSNQDYTDKIFNDLYDKDDEKAKFLLYLLEGGFMSAANYKKFCINGSVSFKTTITIKL